DAPPELLIAERRNRTVIDTVTHPVLIAEDIERLAPQRVGSALGDGVDSAAGEVTLSHVVRGDDELQLLDGGEADRCGVGQTYPQSGVGDHAPTDVVRAL